MYINNNLPYEPNKTEFYKNLSNESVHYYCRSWLTNLANASSLLMCSLPDLNWSGFYLWDGKKLRLGPFQGLPACLEIVLGRGVCGASAQQKKSILVHDVSQFPGHIVCDSNSQSEVVIPLLDRTGQLLGVLDIDSPRHSRFSDEDVVGLQLFVSTLINHTDWDEARSF